jgi:subtilisin-like proprotein convertase family protein
MPDGSCVLSQPTTCAAAGGAFAGAGVACADANCPPGGACCNPDGSCSVRTASACASIAGVFRGPGIACGSANCPTPYLYSGAAVPIADGSAASCGAQAIAAIVVNDSFPVASVDASFFVEHTYQGDLRLTLRHVQTGTTVRMVDRPGFPQTTFGFQEDNYGLNFAGVPRVPLRCADSGTQIYDAPPQGTQPNGSYNVWGLWRPENPLALFVGENSAGTWQLIAEDCGPGDTGRITGWTLNLSRPTPPTCTHDFNGDGDIGTDADIEAFFACLAGNCCAACGSPDFNGDGDSGTDADIESFFRVLAGHPC